MLAEAGHSVCVLEAEPTIGGGARSDALTLDGFIHDLCSAIHPLAVASPAFERLPLGDHGLEWVHPPTPLAHPLDDGTSVGLEHSVIDTAVALGRDGVAYRRMVGPLVEEWNELRHDLLGPLRIPRRPATALRFTRLGLASARSLADRTFSGVRARALLAGLAAHAMLPLGRSPTAAIGLMLAVVGHAAGWPLPRGGAGRISQALAGVLRARGGRIETGRRVARLSDLPPARAVLFDVAPRSLAEIAGDVLPGRYRRRLLAYRHGPGVFKLDWALSEPIPWTARRARRAATVHLGGGLEEIAAAERGVWAGRHPERPFVLLAQPSLFDSSRAPEGRHTAWAYCHVPNGSTRDMTREVEGQIERFAPAFRECVLARHATSPAALEARNANCVGGDIGGGVQDLRQTFARPVLRRVPYATPNRALYLCSASTPPGGGVHGMCGYHAARAALRRSFRATG